MHIRIFRNIPTPTYLYSRNVAHNTPLKIELGKHWEIFITGRFVEDFVGLNTYNKGVKDMDEPRFNVKSVLTKSREFIKLLKDGEIIPFWYGYAYYNFDCDMTAYMPVPFNFVAAGLKWFRHKFFSFKQIPRGWNSTQEVYQRGYQAGKHAAEVIRLTKELESE